MKKRLLIVSNRLPVIVEKGKKGLDFKFSAGGLATGLASFYKSYDSIWIGWPGITSDKTTKEEREEIRNRLRDDFNCVPVFLSRRDIEKYYQGFSNKTLWPLFHYFTQYVTHDRGLWNAYKAVNEKFGEIVSGMAGKDDIIWIHDYHLMLLPELIRKELPNAEIGYFHHIPFPSFEIFRLLPWRTEIIRGLLGSDVVGFHTDDYARHFLISVQRLLGYEYAMGQIHAHDRTVRADIFPMGIDYDKFSGTGRSTEVKKEAGKLGKRLKGYSVILSLDRLDYTKGIIQRLEAFDTFLERNQKYREKVVFVLVLLPSRTQVEQYRILKREIDELVGKINGRYGTIGWSPIRYLYRYLAFPELAALYNIADVCLVTPLRDGMNLIAKEYLASKVQGKGVLIISEMAGASKELSEAIIVNPHNKEEVVGAMCEGLEMPLKEQERRNTAMQQRLSRYNVVRWAEEFIERLENAKKNQKEMETRLLNHAARQRLLNDYKVSEKRLLLLDYDGTLIPFFGRPERARPGKKLLRLLDAIASRTGNKIVLLSGRGKDLLEQWFGSLGIGLVAEHGVWLKGKDQWEMIEPLTSDWKEEIRPLLELYMDRTPGSFIEEKEYSLAWHFRRAGSELSKTRARELIDELLTLTANLNLQITEGKKVVEVKNSGINKGRAALRCIAAETWDFILAMGDDRTDEDMFEVLPDTAYSFKVGLGSSLAKFNLKSREEVDILLEELAP